MCNFLEWKDLKIVYKRYASLYFCMAVDDKDNELITLEVIHRYVELLDKYFGSVSPCVGGASCAAYATHAATHCGGSGCNSAEQPVRAHARSTAVPSRTLTLTHTSRRMVLCHLLCRCASWTLSSTTKRPTSCSTSC